MQKIITCEYVKIKLFSSYFLNFGWANGGGGGGECINIQFHYIQLLDLFQFVDIYLPKI